MLANQGVDRNGLLCCSHLVVLGLFILMIVSGAKLFTSFLDFFYVLTRMYLSLYFLYICLNLIYLLLRTTICK